MHDKAFSKLKGHVSKMKKRAGKIVKIQANANGTIVALFEGDSMFKPPEHKSERGGSIVKLEYTYTFDIPKDIVWKLIQDEEVLRKSIPGCKSFSRMEEGIYQAEMGISVGPVKGLFTGQVQQVDQQQPASYRLLVHGKGLPGEIDAVADMQLDEVEQGTLLTCKTDVQVTGVLASVGQRVMGGVAKMIVGQFFKAADKEMKLLAASHSE